MGFACFSLELGLVFLHAASKFSVLEVVLELVARGGGFLRKHYNAL